MLLSFISSHDPEASMLPQAALQALQFMPAAVLACALEWYFDISLDKSVLLPTSTLVGLMITFRVNHAYDKWLRANRVARALGQSR